MFRFYWDEETFGRVKVLCEDSALSETEAYASLCTLFEVSNLIPFVQVRSIFDIFSNDIFKNTDGKKEILDVERFILHLMDMGRIHGVYRKNAGTHFECRILLYATSITEAERCVRAAMRKANFRISWIIRPYYEGLHWPPRDTDYAEGKVLRVDYNGKE